MFDRKLYEKRFESMRQEASQWRPTWQEIQTYISPTRGFFNQTPNRGNPIDYKKIFDGTQTRDLRTLASGMTSGLTSPSRPWFKLGLADEDLISFKPVTIWLSTVQDRMMNVFAKSNIYGALYSIYEEIGAFGTGAMSIVEDYSDVIRARNYTCGEYFFSVGPDGRVNGFARDYWNTVGQLVEEFGLENCSDMVKNYYKTNEVDQWINLRHIIEKNRKQIPGLINNLNMPWTSLYWEVGSRSDQELRKSGFEEFPVLGPRWSVPTTFSIYGHGPGADALGDVRMLQKMQKDKLLGLDKVVNPPVQVDANVQGEPNMLPGGVTRFSGNLTNAGVMSAYEVRIDLNAVQAVISETQNAIGRTFYRDLFLMIAQTGTSGMTAREIVERHEEKLLMLGPVLERLESELLDPLIDRTFAIMNRVGLIPKPPEELQGMDLKVEYVSMLAQAQKMVGTTAVEQATRYVTTVAGIKPEVLDVFDFDQSTTDYCRMLGINPKIIRSPDEIEMIRKARADQAAQAEMAPNVSAAIQGAKNLSQTSLDGNNALSALLRG